MFSHHKRHHNRRDELLMNKHGPRINQTIFLKINQHERNRNMSHSICIYTTKETKSRSYRDCEIGIFKCKISQKRFIFESEINCQKISIRVENFWKWQRVVGQRQFYPKIHTDPILLLKYGCFIFFGFFRDRVNFDDYHRENIYLYDWPILMIITIFADIYNWFMRFTWSGNMLQWGHRSHRIPKELKVVSHFVALVEPVF